jgi:O-methyltransferase involved in polyketide biosynthesis
MSKTLEQDLNGVPETLLITLYLRAMETQRPDALIKDEKAEEMFQKIGDEGLYDFNRMKSLHLSEENKLVIILRNREIDRCTREYLARRPDAVVVHIGCGLDTRFERVAERNGQAEWYDLDLPHVIDLRRKLMGDEAGRRHLLGCSVLEDEWLDRVSVHRRCPFLFLAEGVFMYFTEMQVKHLVLTLRDRFPGAELVFDAYSPIHVWRHNLQYLISKIKFPTHWGIWHGQEIEGWGSASPAGAGIRLLGEWGYFDEETPRLNRIRWLRGIEAAARTFRIYHFQLGKPAE